MRLLSGAGAVNTVVEVFMDGALMKYAGNSADDHQEL